MTGPRSYETPGAFSPQNKTTNVIYGGGEGGGGGEKCIPVQKRTVSSLISDIENITTEIWGFCGTISSVCDKLESVHIKADATTSEWRSFACEGPIIDRLSALRDNMRSLSAETSIVCGRLHDVI
jgi:hypothetical protein